MNPSCELCSPGSPRPAWRVLVWKAGKNPSVKQAICRSHYEHAVKVLRELSEREGPYDIAFVRLDPADISGTWKAKTLKGAR